MSGGPIISTSHLCMSFSSINPAENPSTGFLFSSAMGKRRTGLDNGQGDGEVTSGWTGEQFSESKTCRTLSANISPRRPAIESIPTARTHQLIAFSVKATIESLTFNK